LSVLLSYSEQVFFSPAKKSGHRYCFLDSSDEGFNLYVRLGFKVYCMTLVYEINKGILLKIDDKWRAHECWVVTYEDWLKV